MRLLLITLLSLTISSCGSVRFDVNGVDRDKNQVSQNKVCNSDAECGEGKVCATVKGEFPGSCALGFKQAAKTNSWEDHYQKINAKFDSKLKPEDKFPIIEEAIKPESIASFKKIKCKKLNHDKCTEQFQEMLHARLALEYGKEGRDIFDENCKAYPEACDKPHLMEMAYIRAHNIKVNNSRKEWFANEKANVEADARAARPVLILHSP